MLDIAKANVAFYAQKLERAKHAYSLAFRTLSSRIAEDNLDRAQEDLNYWTEYRDGLEGK